MWRSERKRRAHQEHLKHLRLQNTKLELYVDGGPPLISATFGMLYSIAVLSGTQPGQAHDVVQIDGGRPIVGAKVLRLMITPLWEESEKGMNHG